MLFLIAAFIIAIGLELFYAKKHALPVYKFGNTVSHFNLGIGQTVLGALTATTLAGVYSFFYNTFHFIEFAETGPKIILLAVIAADLSFYVGHRFSHRVNFFVASHVVHHQANDFNHGSALRQSWTSRVVLFLFYVPLAFIGIPLKALLAALAINLFIQFFSHNGVIRRKLGILEFLFVTPRTHRVHHGTNRPYIDKNFGGIFVIWDRMFGTFQELDEAIPVEIGPREGTNPYDPITANLNYFHRILFVTRLKSGLIKKAQVWFDSPEMLERELLALKYIDPTPRPVLPKYTRETKFIVMGALALTLTLFTYFMMNKEKFDGSEKLIVASMVIVGAWTTGRLLVDPNLLFNVKRERL